MPISSFLAFTAPGKKEAVQAHIESIEYTEVFPSTNNDLLVVLVETVTDDEEKEIRLQIESNLDILCLSLVSSNDNPLEMTA